MDTARLTKRRDGRSSVTLAKHSDCVIRVLNPGGSPHRAGSQRAKAWEAVARMDGMTVRQAHDELRRLEPGIQGKVGRPLGWVVTAIDKGNVELLR
jgi:hypothetical protein